MGESREKGGSKLKGVFYLAATGGFLYWARRSHIFTQFRHVRDIPQSYLDQHIKLRGTVAAVLPDATLRVHHEPIIPVEHWLNTKIRPDASPACINVKVAAVHLAEVGKQHLNKHVVGDRVWFEPVVRNDNAVLAVITAKRPGERRPIMYNLNRDLIERGYGRVLDNSVQQHVQALKVPAYSRLVNHMQIVQRGSDSTVSSEVSESILTWPIHLRQVVQNSSAYQILVMACSGFYITLIRLYHFGRILAGRERSEIVVRSPSDAVRFVQRYGFGMSSTQSDPKLNKSYNFERKNQRSTGVQMPEITLGSVFRLFTKLLKLTLSLIGLIVKNGVQLGRTSLAVGRKAINNAQEAYKK